MAFRASTEILVQGLTQAKDVANRIKRQCNEVSADSAAGPIERIRVINLLRSLRYSVDEWNRIKAIPGMAQYARDQENDQTYDVTVEFNTMVSAANQLADWIFNNLPTDGGTGAILERTIDSEGVATALTFTSAQLATMRTHIATFVATIA